VIGRYLAKSLGLHVGDSVTLITLSEGENGTAIPKLTIFRIAGVVSSGYRELDANWFFIRAEVAQKTLSSATSTAYLGIKIKDPYGSGLDHTLATLKELFPQHTIRSWRTIEQSLFRSFSSTRSILVFVMILAALVAAINLGSALTTFVIEHRIEIAILRSFGLSREQIVLVFLFGGSLTGIVGIIAGSTVGIGISLFVNQIIGGIQWLITTVRALFSLGSPAAPLLNPDYYLEHIPITMNWNYIGLILGIGVVISILVSLIPALKASKIPPSDLIRQE